MMVKRKDDDESQVNDWSAPHTFHFSKPANDNQSPFRKKIVPWVAAVVGLGSIVALLIM